MIFEEYKPYDRVVTNDATAATTAHHNNSKHATPTTEEQASSATTEARLERAFTTTGERRNRKLFSSIRKRLTRKPANVMATSNVSADDRHMFIGELSSQVTSAQDGSHHVIGHVELVSVLVTS